MEIGEFESEDLTELLNRSQELEKRFNFYCRQQRKKLDFLFTTAIASETYYLKVFIKTNDYGNNGEIKTS
jgi:hypothetical protein